jgi:hypothetical protein
MTVSALNQSIVWVKEHKGIVLGGVVGLLVLYFIFKYSAQSQAANTSGGTTDLSGGANAVMGLTAAASLQNAQINGAVETAQLQAGVQDNLTAATLQANLAKTAADLAAHESDNNAAMVIATGAQQAGVQQTAINVGGNVQIAQIQADADVNKTAIVGATIDTLGAQHAAVESQMLTMVGKQVTQIQDHSKHASQDYAAIAPIIALETGQGGAAVGTAQANAAKSVGTTQAVTSTVSTLGTGLLKGLFGAA